MRLPLPMLLLCLLAGCAAMPQAETDTVFLVARHAEKADDGSADPQLSEAGRGRAQSLATALADVPLRAVYATPTRRTRETALPTAQRRGLPVRDYDPARTPSETATLLHMRHAGQQVLMIGHSDTVPALVASLCACPVAPLAEDAYGDLYEIRIGADGRATLQRRRF
ncbi:SixA phosphatase family protein [Luteimonas huabeiensis]|uniref:SixA phosphatase family protein n=1 Tax=Luteimonas huabeiensis TaxID=1244513 RepID=UPI0004679A7C|nr:phosphoglycerate mutase family protein [Luteimonas huabeiensis]